MIENSYFRFLAKSSVFTLIPEALDELAPFMETQLVTPGKIIFNKGDILDSLIIPLQEPLNLTSEKGSFLLQKGRTLALTHFLRGAPLPYSVISEDFNKILVLPKHYFMNYLEKNKLILSYLMLMTECESFRRIKHTLTEKNISQEDILKLSGVISSPTSYNENLLKKGIVLIEEGSFSIESSEFSGTLKGGEFVGGFNAVNRPNPGYNLTGVGKVRVVDTEQLRSIGLDKTILEYFASDPWVKSEKVSINYYSEVTAIPAEAFIPWDQENISIDPQNIKVSTSDWDSIKETIFMLLRHNQIEINKSFINNRLLRVSETICFSVIAEILEHQGLLTRILKWKDDVNILKFPLIVPFGNRIIYVLALEDNMFSCFDGCLGFYKIKKEFLIENCPDTTISIQAMDIPKGSPELDVKIKRSKTLSFVWKIIITEKSTALRIALLTLMTYLIGMLTPKFSELVLDEVLRTEDHQTLWMCLTGLGLVGFFTVLFNFLKNKLITKSSMTLDDILTRLIFSKAQSLSPSSFSKIGTGGVLSRLSEVEKIRSFFSTESLSVLFGLGSTIVYGSMLASYSSVLIFFILGYFLLILIVQYFGRKSLYKINLVHFNLESKTNSFIGDCISNVLAIKAFSASTSMSEKWESLNIGLSECGKKSAMLASLLDSIVELLGQAVKIGIIWYCISKINTSSNQLSFGQIFAIIQLIGQTISPMGGFVHFLSSIEDMRLSVDKLNDIIFSNSEEDELAKHSVNITGKIKFDRVSFKYSEDLPLVLKDISLTIYPGQSVAIVGKSGSGKTSIANLIAKENFPTTGRIFFDDVDSSFIDSSEIKSQVGYIQQNNHLFSGTIKSNVAFKDEAPDSKRLEYAYSIANCDSFVQSFPQHDETYLSEGGMGLSGGQKQRLTMARTIYANPVIMILDEATSALDSESEGIIINKLLENKGKITSIVIAHRLSTIRNADFVYVMDEGHIVQEGTHNELIQKEGVYKELFQDQAS